MQGVGIILSRPATIPIPHQALQLMQGLLPASTASAWDSNLIVPGHFRYGRMYLQMGRWKRFFVSLPKNGPNPLSALTVVAALLVTKIGSGGFGRSPLIITPLILSIGASFLSPFIISAATV